MSEHPASVEVVRREASEALERPLPPMDDGEVAALWRTAKALAESGLFKDARQAGQAFAKLLAGRDLGLTPFEAMSSLHVIGESGKIEASADLHATRVRQREGYDYRVWWLKIEPPAAGEAQTDPPRVEAVAADDEEPADLRDTYGCVVEFTIDGERRGIARWTLGDTARAGLASKDNHKKYPRSMCFARAMSQGVALHVPEVMGGLRVYAPGELGQGESGEDLAAGAGEAPAMDDLPTAVEAVLARARELGHAGLASREAATMAVRGRSPEQVGQWVTRATRALNRVARGHAPEPEPADAEVVPDTPASGSGTSNEVAESEPAQNEPVSAPEGAETPDTASDPPDGAQGPQGAAQRDESAEVVDGEAVAESVAVLDARASALRARLHELEGDPDDDPDGEQHATLCAELDAVEAQRAAAADPQQGALGV